MRVCVSGRFVCAASASAQATLLEAAQGKAVRVIRPDKETREVRLRA